MQFIIPVSPVVWISRRIRFQIQIFISMRIQIWILVRLFEFYSKNILKVGNRSKKHTCEGTTALLKGRKPGLFVNFGKFPCSWIRIRFPIMDLICIQGIQIKFESMRIRIHIIAAQYKRVCS
jgi:hypothetical protein